MSRTYTVCFVATKQTRYGPVNNTDIAIFSSDVIGASSSEFARDTVLENAKKKFPPSDGWEFDDPNVREISKETAYSMWLNSRPEDEIPEEHRIPWADKIEHT